MIVYKKVKLNKKEIALFKASLLLRGETFRSWCQKCAGRDDVKTTGFVSNIIATGMVSKKVYEKVLKPLNLPFFKDFEWEEEINTIRVNVDDLEEVE